MTNEVVDLTKPEPTKILSVDCGTMNLVAAELDEHKEVKIKMMRNMYLPVSKEHITTVELQNIDYVDIDDSVFIIGEDAYRFANIFGKDVKRPMNQGLISSGDVDSLDVLNLMIEHLVGKTKNGICTYSVPAPSVDINNDIVYHQGVFHRIFTGLGYRSQAFNEATAVIYSECKDENFSGWGISMGAGMSNCSITYKSAPVISFSVARGGDWIDQSVARSLGTIPNRITSVKENNTDLSNYRIGKKKERRIREAIIYYYRELIQYVIETMKKKVEEDLDNIDLPEELPIVISGGTSLATGFIPMFQEILGEYENLPFEVKEVRSAENPLTSVAEGLLIRSLMQKDLNNG